MKPSESISGPRLWQEARLGLELASLVRDPIFRGEGMTDAREQPVLLIPGFLAGDGSLTLMTRWLRGTGHHARRTGMRSNVSCSELAVSRLEERLELLYEHQGRRVAVVGQSRGGLFARVLASRRPDLVSGVVTLGSPHRGMLELHRLVRLQVLTVGALGSLGVPGLFNHSCLLGDCCKQFEQDLQGAFPPGVGFVSIYSKSDGVVNWNACLDPAARHVEVRASHCGMGVNAGVYRALGAELARLRRLEERRLLAARARRAPKAPRLRRVA
jgi:pimeloyl-ACP methyl ester carboxylesterase